MTTAKTANLSRRTGRTPRPPTRICCEAPGATAVAVAGSFNDWDTESTPLQHEDEGQWSVKLDLPPGRYEYKFLVDGCWCCEHGTDDAEPAGDRVPNVFGTMNLVLVVE